MRILYLAHRIPFPPNKGERIRALRVIRHLAQRHEVWCACFRDDPMEPRESGLESMVHRLEVVDLTRGRALARGARFMLTGATVTEGFYAHPRITALVNAWMNETRFDAVVAFSSSMANLALSVPAGRRILDLCDVDSAKWQDYVTRSRWPMRSLYAVEAERLAARERAWIDAFDVSIVACRRELDAIRDARLQRKVRVVRNGVDLPEAVEEFADDPGRRIVGFAGDLSYRPNVEGLEWFVGRCWPSLVARIPGVELHLVGRRPGNRVIRLRRTPGVRLFADVPTVAPYLRSFHVSIAPMPVAHGVQNKVLEAFAWGKPVVMTAAVARGLDGEEGEPWIVADGEAHFASEVARLLADEDHRQALGSAARSLVRREYAWEPQLELFERLVTGQTTLAKEAVSRRTATPQTMDSPISG